MSLKDNFYQAVKELLNHGGLVGSDMEEQAREQSELDSYLDKPAQPSEFDAVFDAAFSSPVTAAAAAGAGGAVPVAVSSPLKQPKMGADMPGVSATYGSGGQTGYQQNGQAFRQPPVRAAVVPQPRMDGGGVEPDSSSEMTIISKNTIIDGNIRSFASISVEGNVKGCVDVTKDAHVSGKVVGDIKCSNAVMVGSAIQGNVLTKGHVVFDGDSLLLGDLSAQQAEINGKIRGNISVSGRTEFRSDAVILGDIKTSAIVVLDGANIQGYIDTSYISENVDRVFPGGVSIDEE